MNQTKLSDPLVTQESRSRLQRGFLVWTLPSLSAHWHQSVRSSPATWLTATWLSTKPTRPVTPSVNTSTAQSLVGLYRRLIPLFQSKPQVMNQPEEARASWHSLAYSTSSALKFSPRIPTSSCVSTMRMRSSSSSSTSICSQWSKKSTRWKVSRGITSLSRITNRQSVWSKKRKLHLSSNFSMNNSCFKPVALIKTYSKPSTRTWPTVELSKSQRRWDPLSLSWCTMLVQSRMTLMASSRRTRTPWAISSQRILPQANCS